MAKKLFKLVVNAVTDTTTEMNPSIQAFFYEFDESQRINDTIIIPSTLFADGDDNLLTGNLPTTTPENGYYLLFINGILQQNSLYAISADGSEVVITDAATVIPGTPINLIVATFAAVSNSETTITS